MGAETDYVVLRRDEGADRVGDVGQIWRIADSRVSAHSADAACREVARASDAEGVYVAVPIRSWSPAPQRKKVQTTWTTDRSAAPQPAAD